MVMRQAKKLIVSLLERAGVAINGPRPFDIQVYNEALYARIVRHRSLGLGESYMDGWWDSHAPDQFIAKILEANVAKNLSLSWWSAVRLALGFVKDMMVNPQSRRRSFIVGERHYDIGNDIYEAMLDRRMVYTCGYWLCAKTLDQAQEAKLDLVCRKIGLKENDAVLDIGCGWGSFLKFAAEKYGARGTGITVSREQVALASRACEKLPVSIVLQDYRDMRGTFDHVVSLGMFEHVGYRNYRTYMEKVHSVLKDDGLFLLHTIGENRSVVSGEPWLSRYIFPNGMLPSMAQIGSSLEGLFVIEDVHNFGADYDKTLMAWHDRFECAWPTLREKYGERFRRMWKYYLLSCAAIFRARTAQLWQFVLSKKGVKGGYRFIR